MSTTKTHQAKSLHLIEKVYKVITSSINEAYVMELSLENKLLNHGMQQSLRSFKTNLQIYIVMCNSINASSLVKSPFLTLHYLSNLGEEPEG